MRSRVAMRTASSEAPASAGVPGPGESITASYAGSMCSSRAASVASDSIITVSAPSSLRYPTRGVHEAVVVVDHEHSRHSTSTSPPER